MRLLKMVRPATRSTPYLHTMHDFGWTIGESRRPEVFDVNERYHRAGYPTKPRPIKPKLCSWSVLHAFLSFEQAYFCADQCGTRHFSVALLATSTSPLVLSGNKAGVQELTPIADVSDQAPSWFPKVEYGWPTRGTVMRDFSFIKGMSHLGYGAGVDGAVKVIYRHVTGKRWPEAHQYSASQTRRSTADAGDSLSRYHDELIRFWTEQMPALYAGIKGEPPVHLAELYTPQEAG